MWGQVQALLGYVTGPATSPLASQQRAKPYSTKEGAIKYATDLAAKISICKIIDEKSKALAAKMSSAIIIDINARKESDYLDSIDELADLTISNKCEECLSADQPIDLAIAIQSIVGDIMNTSPSRYRLLKSIAE
jgi:hypothetical protein